jgi:hypothetical protein
MTHLEPITEQYRSYQYEINRLWSTSRTALDQFTEQ